MADKTGSKVFEEDEFFLQIVNINQDLIDNPEEYNELGSNYSNENMKMCSDITKFINQYPDNIKQIEQLIKKYLFIIFSNNSIRYNRKNNYNYNVQKILINYVDIDNISKNDHLNLIVNMRCYNNVTNKEYKNKILDIVIKFIDSDYFDFNILLHNNFWKINNGKYLLTYLFEKYPDTLTCQNLYRLIGSDYKLLKEMIIRFDKYEFIVNIKNYHDYNYTLLMVYLTDYKIANIELDEIKWIISAASNISDNTNSKDNIDNKDNMDNIKDLLIGKFCHPDDDGSDLYLSPLSYIISYYPNKFDLIDYFMETHKKYYDNK